MVSAGQLGDAAKVVAPGLVVMAFVYSLGDVSGAHFNPVVTLAFAARGVFRWSCVPAYWLAQLVGGNARRRRAPCPVRGCRVPRRTADTCRGVEGGVGGSRVDAVVGTRDLEHGDPGGVVGPNAADRGGRHDTRCAASSVDRCRVRR